MTPLEPPALVNFISGVQAAGYAAVGAFFLRFFTRTRDHLFLAFAGAFGLMALNQVLVSVLDIPSEEQSPIYLLRLAAFLLIVGAILSKNLAGRDR